MIMTARATRIAAGLMGLYGLLAATGGAIGYVTKGSLPSLIAGSVSGLILVACAVAALRRPLLALSIGLVAILALLAKFVPDLARSLGAASESINGVALLMTAGGVLVLAAVVVALGGGGAFRGRS